MWKSIKSEVPRGNTNIIVTDKHGGFCLIRTNVEGGLPTHRYMMKTKDDYYYSSRTLVTEWMEISVLRQIICGHKDTLCF